MAIFGATLLRMKIVGWVLFAVGVAVLVVGILLGTGGISRGGTNCGSGFGGVSDAAFVKDLTNAMGGQLTDVQAACQSAVDDRKTFALAVTVPGGIVALAGLITWIAGYGHGTRPPKSVPWS